MREFGCSAMARHKGVDEICPETLKALEDIGLSWVADLCQHLSPLKWEWLFPFVGKRNGECVPVIKVLTVQPPLEIFIIGFWKIDQL